MFSQTFPKPCQCQPETDPSLAQDLAHWTANPRRKNSSGWVNVFLTKKLFINTTLIIVKTYTYHDMILLMEEILHQLIGSLSHNIKGFIHPRWLFRISSINNNIIYHEHVQQGDIPNKYPLYKVYMESYYQRGPHPKGFPRHFPKRTSPVNPAPRGHQASSIRSHAADSDKADAVGSS